MSGYIGNFPVPQATQTRDTFTATAGQTSSETSGYTPSFLDVFINGVHLVNGTDYTARNGSEVVLTSGAADGDVLEVLSFGTFQTGDFVPTSGGTFNGSVTVPSLTSTNAITASGGVYLGGTGLDNLLEDYETGTWTPQVAGGSGGTNPTMGSDNAGWYVRVGNVVHIGGTIHATNAGCILGSTIVSGLPFLIQGTLGHRSSGSLGANAGVFTADSTYPNFIIVGDPGYTFFYAIKKNDQTNSYSHVVSVTTGHISGFWLVIETNA
jgi:hypothetical protein